MPGNFECPGKKRILSPPLLPPYRQVELYLWSVDRPSSRNHGCGRGEKGTADPIPGCRIYLSIVFGEITVDFVRFCPSVKRDIISDFFFFCTFSLVTSQVIR